LLKGGQVVAYGGKTLPAGGYYSMPKLFGEGWVVVGDSASMVDVQKLKGIHLAMKSGMLAAETAVSASVENDYSSQKLSSYSAQVDTSYISEQLYKVRNFHQALSQGLFFGLPQIALQELTGGRGLLDPMSLHADASTTESVIDIWGAQGLKHEDNQLPKPDGVLFFDKLSSVYLTGTHHDEDSPNHLLLQNGDICRTVCEPQYKSPCTHFCPASVYEMVPSSAFPNSLDLKINYTNCIHCKTCDIKCPFENIEWTVPEGGGGPKYTET
jgi:electron-transferring-flavoprotein dehydrogenase